MKLKVILMTVFLAMACYSNKDSTANDSRCIGIRPICAPGKHAICICESDYSLKCAWVCASS